MGSVGRLSEGLRAAVPSIASTQPQPPQQPQQAQQLQQPQQRPREGGRVATARRAHTAAFPTRTLAPMRTVRVGLPPKLTTPTMSVHGFPAAGMRGYESNLAT